MKRGNLVRIKTGFSDLDGRIGLVLSKVIPPYFEVFVEGSGVHYYMVEHVEVLS